MMCGIMWLCALMVVGTALVGANPMRRTGNGIDAPSGGQICMPKATAAYDGLAEKVLALPMTSKFRRDVVMMGRLIGAQTGLDLMTEEGRHALVCRLDEAESVDDLVQSLNLQEYEEQFRQMYLVYTSVYARLGGIQGIISFLETADDFLEWAIQTGFPSIPFTGATEEELQNALLELYAGTRPIWSLSVIGAMNESAVEVLIRYVAHIFAVSTTDAEFNGYLGELLPVHIDIRHVLNQITPDMPAYLEAIRAYKVILKEYDQNGLFTLPPN